MLATGTNSFSRRSVLKAAGAAGLIATTPWSVGSAVAYTGETDLDVEEHAWEDPLPLPGVWTPVSRKGGVDYYEIEMLPTSQQVLPTSMNLWTDLWGYGGKYPADTIEARPGRKVEVKWSNTGLPDEHVLTDAVDTRVHGAEESVPEVRTVVHLHGGVVAPEDDGYPEAWVAQDGTTTLASSPVPYKQTKEYPNVQEPTTLWYHDHALGITRLNVYAGLAGFYMLREPAENSLPSGEYEVPILIQDRTFNDDGSLHYPPGGGEYEAEFFGDIPVINGKAYPFLEVEPRTYRFRFLNGSNNRAFNMKFRNDTEGNTTAVPMMQQIGVDQGFLENVVTVGPGGDVPTLLLSGAERADVVVDFSAFEGDEFTLLNGAGIPYAGEPFDINNDMPELLKIKVTKPLAAPDETVPPAQFLDIVGRVIDRYDFAPDVGDPVTTRTFSLDSGVYEEMDSHFLDLSFWDDPDAVVHPVLNTSEIWEFVNATGDSHPIHTHLVDFEVVNRESFTWDDGSEEGDEYADAVQDYLDNLDDDPEKPDLIDYITFSGTPTQPTPNNKIKKDTVLINPREVVRIKPEFTGFTGHFPWHCHILEHEDQEMMLPFEVVEPSP